jgi:serine/threonine-protein kinase
MRAMPPQIPETVGRYRVVSELGRGAMGAVYRGTDPKLDRTVAIKMISSAMGAGDDREEILARFEREARVSARLQHPNVVAVYDVGAEGDELYLVMELVEGEDISHRLARGEFPPIPEALEMIAQAADALGAAHEAGIIHRDVKPGNLLVTTKGRIKVSDFGVAKAVGEKTDLTSTGMMVGSPAYMSPEQVKGMTLDGRSDLFSLGVVLFEMLLHRKPFPADTVTTLVYQILHEDPMQDVPIPEAVSPDLADFLRWTLAKDRENRVPDARTFAMRARSLAAGEPLVRPEAMTPTAMLPVGGGAEARTAVMRAAPPAAQGTTQVAEKKKPIALYAGIAAAVVAVAAVAMVMTRNEPAAAAPERSGAAPAVTVQTLERAPQSPSAGPAQIPGQLTLSVPDQNPDDDAAASETEADSLATDLAETAEPEPPRAPARNEPRRSPATETARRERATEPTAPEQPQEQAQSQTQQAPRFEVPQVEFAETYETRRAVEFHVRPDSAIVTINGVRIGKADDWDGFAGGRQYAFTASGNYYAEFSLPGHRTTWVRIVVNPDARDAVARVRTKLPKE